MGNSKEPLYLNNLERFIYTKVNILVWEDENVEIKLTSWATSSSRKVCALMLAQLYHLNVFSTFTYQLPLCDLQFAHNIVFQAFD